MVDVAEDLSPEMQKKIQKSLDEHEAFFRNQSTSLIIETIKEIGLSGSTSDEDAIVLAVLFKVYAERAGERAANALFKSLID